ncbi:MAG: hypothetical protein AAFR88_00690 [Pseudomonadota bacterium]
MWFRRALVGAALVGAALAPTLSHATGRASYGLNLRAVVPVTCSVRFQPNGNLLPQGTVFNLGSFLEYCNSPSGYRLVVNYTPGTLRGATVQADNDRVVLDGSGQTVLTQSTGARRRMRNLQIIPGESGFDTDRLTLDILVN